MNRALRRIIRLVAALVVHLPPAPASFAAAQEAAGATSERTLLREAESAGALPATLRRELANRLRILDVAAHPDDEDGALLRLHAEQGAETFTAFSTRGEGGQNTIGGQLFRELGTLRESETLAASAVVGSTPWFLGFPDFGYSKRADETFTRWGGRDEVVRRLTFVIRRLRPHRIFTNHPQTGGHGHHQATSIALHEAVVAAGDAARYPEQIAQGLSTWSADALFVRLGKDDPDSERTLEYDYDEPLADDPAGATYAAVAHAALLKHASQGPWRPFDPATKHRGRYVLTWSPQERRTLRDLPDRTASLSLAQDGAAFTVSDLLALLESAPFGDSARPSPERVGSWLQALCGAEIAFPDDDPEAPAEAVLPGHTLRVLLLLHGRDALWRGAEAAAALRRLVPRFTLSGPGTVTAQVDAAAIAARPDLAAQWRDALAGAATLAVAPGAASTWITEDHAASPFSAARRHPLSLRVELLRDDVALAEFSLPISKAIAPAVAGELSRDPLPLVRSPGAARATGFVRLAFPTGRVPQGPLRLVAPSGCSFESLGARLAALPFTLEATSNRGDRASPRFDLPFVLLVDALPAPAADRATVRRRLEFRLAFADGAPITTVAGELAVLDVTPPSGVRVAFVVGTDGSAGDAIDDLGVPCTRLSAEALAHEPLSRFTHVLLDLRTLGASAALRDQSARLREFAGSGGHVVALYHKPVEWNEWEAKGLSPAPLPLQISDARVCEEDAAVTLLLPGDRRFLEPNVILPRDFADWVQERGLCFPRKAPPPGPVASDAPAGTATAKPPPPTYADGYLELLACADRGEEPLRGGWLEWRGEAGGSFTLLSLALHRQWRAAHGGAYRLLANLLARPGG
jgi:LmbE family N-acetylglucosaminyl deacetylase